MTGEGVLFILFMSFIVGYFLVSAGLRLSQGNKNRQSEETCGPNFDQTPSEPQCRQWYDVLGVDQDCSTEEIRRAYRQKIAGYHPDRMAGLGPDLLELAEERSKEINAAYRAALKLRGI